MSVPAVIKDKTNYYLVFENMISGFAYHKIISNSEGKPVDYEFLAVNKAFERLTGLRRTDILGKKVTEVHPGIVNQKFDWIGIYGKVALTGESIAFEQYFEPHQRWYFISAYCPRKGFFAVTFENITERKMIEDALRKSEKNYKQLFNSIVDCILVTDTERNIIDCNRALLEVFGYKFEEILKKKTINLYAREKEYQEMGNELKKQIDNARFTYTINYKKKSGEIFPGETNVFFLKNDQNETVGFIGIIRDITHRTMVEESLQKANDELKSKTVELEDTNTALNVLLKKRDEENLELEENIYSNYELMITPFLSKLKTCSNNRNRQNLLDIIEKNLQEIVAPFAKRLSNPIMSLTSSEIQIATMIKQGYSNKEIATILNSSKRTIDTHRQNIRRKLNLKNEKINLRTYLMNL